MSIVVLASAARVGGARSILNQFLNALPTFIGKEDYYIFIDYEFPTTKINGVSYIKVNTRSWIQRIIFDTIKVKKWLKNNQISPRVIISFQNTGCSYSHCHQLIYYHQLITLFDYKWNFIKKEERTLWLYKNIYSFFVKLYMQKDSQFVLQVPYGKKLFIQKFKVNPDNVHVICPDVKAIDINSVLEEHYTLEEIHFIYPAPLSPHKNHIDLIHAVNQLHEEQFTLAKKIRIHLTCNKDNSHPLVKQIIDLSIEDNFIFEGRVSYDRMMTLYKSTDGMLFPSYIESFGLPLIEAASFGLPILATDTPSARDVIEKYEGIHFIELHNIEDWAVAIKECCINKKKYAPMLQNTETNWDKFFKVFE